MKEHAAARSEQLMLLALQIYDDAPDLADAYVEHARTIAMAAKVRIPRHVKRYICHGCKRLLVPTRTMRTRTHHRKGDGSYLAVTCLRCGHITRYPYKMPKKRPENTPREKHAGEIAK